MLPTLGYLDFQGSLSPNFETLSTLYIWVCDPLGGALAEAQRCLPGPQGALGSLYVLG